MMRVSIKRAAIIMVVVAFGIGLSGCVGNPSREDVGTVGGAAIGIGLGSLVGGGNGKVAAMILGGIAGAVIGGDLGRELDQADHERASGLAYRGLGDPRHTRSQDAWVTRHGIRVETHVITRPEYHMYGTVCRSFTQETTMYRYGRPERWIEEGVACYDRAHGVWVIQ